MVLTRFKDGRVYFRNSGMKGLNDTSNGGTGSGKDTEMICDIVFSDI